MRKPEVGEVLYLVHNYGEGEKRNVTVTKVGRIYFEVDNEPKRKFRIEDWYQHDNKFYCLARLWESKEIYEQYEMAKDYKIGLPMLMSKLDVKQTIEVYNFVKELLNKE